MAQPKPARNIMARPSGSMCFSGLRVMRPISRAVSSPHLSATQPWALSCTDSASIMPGSIISRPFSHSRGDAIISLKLNSIFVSLKDSAPAPPNYSTYGEGVMNVYDFDNTVISGDSSFLFYVWCLRRHPKILRRLPGVAYYAVRYLKKDKQRFKQHMFGYLNDLPDPEREVSAFWDRNLSRVKAYYLRGKMEDDVIISASPLFLVAPAMARLGVKGVISSPVDMRTGVYGGLNCHGEEKVRRFKQEYPDAVVDGFYSDSLSDAPLSRLAKKAFLVKGDKLLPWPE